MRFTSSAVVSALALTTFTQAWPSPLHRRGAHFVNPLPKIPSDAVCSRGIDWFFVIQWSVYVPFDPAKGTPHSCGLQYLLAFGEHWEDVSGWECKVYGADGYIIDGPETDNRTVGLGMDFVTNAFATPKQILDGIKKGSGRTLFPQKCDSPSVVIAGPP